MKDYEDLIIWQKGINIVMLVYQLTKTFPKEELFGLTSQMKRSAVSIPSNISEGWGRNTDKTFIQYLNYSKGSICELSTQCLIAKELNYINLESYNKIKSMSTELSKMIYFFSKHLMSKAGEK